MPQTEAVQMHQMTGLGRPIDLSTKSNIIAIAGSALAGASSVLLSWLSTGDLGVPSATSVAIGVFLAWALAREIDPDTVSSSYLAMAIAAVIGLISSPAALVVAVLLLTTRVLAGTVGTALRPLDLLVLAAAGGYAGSQPVAWPIVGLMIYAVRRSGNPHARIASVSIGVISVGSALIFVTDLTPGVPGLGTWIVLLVLAGIGWRHIRSTAVHGSADSGARIASSGVAIARLGTLTAIAAGAVLAPETALGDLGPAIAAFTAMAVWPRRIPTPATILDEPTPVLDPAAPLLF